MPQKLLPIFSILIIFTVIELSNEGLLPDILEGCYRWNMWVEEEPNKKGIVCKAPTEGLRVGVFNTDGYCGTVEMDKSNRRLWIGCRNASWCYKVDGCDARYWEEWCYEQEYPVTFKRSCTYSKATIFYNTTVQKCCCKGDGCNKNLFEVKKSGSARISISFLLITVLSLFTLI